MIENLKKVLIVEDNPAQLKLLSFLLKKLNITAVTAPSAESAIEVMKDESVDFMLLDIALGPGMTGLELMKLFRKESRFASIPIAAVTANWIGGEHELYEMGFTGFLEKPYTPMDLKLLIDKITNS